MKRNLAWNDALAVAASEFPGDTQRVAWPPALTIGQIAALQRPFNDEDGAGRRAYAVLFITLAAACAAEEIEHSTVSVEKITPARYVKGRTQPTWDEPPRSTLRIEPASKETIQHRHITAATFANWLAAQPTEQPSQHIRAWFAANGVSVPEVPVAAPVQGMAVAQGEAAPVQPAAAPDRIVKKAVLVAELEREWPTIESDLSDARRNGLKAAAGTDKHGYWRLEAARRWAAENYRLAAEPKPTAAITNSPWPQDKTRRHSSARAG